MSRPVGIIARFVVAGLSFLVGLALIWLAAFAATFKLDEPEWDGEAVTILVLGISTLVVGLSAAIRPSRLTWLLCLLMAAAIPVGGAVM